MKTSTKHLYGILQSHNSCTASLTTPSQKEWGRPWKGTELLGCTDTEGHQAHLEGEQVFD